MAKRRAMRHLGLFEDFKSKNITVDDVVRCINAGGVVYATVVRGMPDNDPDMPMMPVSVDDSGLVTVFVDGAYREVDLRNIDKIEWSGGAAGRLDEALLLSNDLGNVIGHMRPEDKVADFLAVLTDSDAYSTDEDVNYLELSREINKFSFMPRNRRKKDHMDNFDSESMPTRIGKLIRKIHKTVEDNLTLKVKGEQLITRIGDAEDEDVLDRYDKLPAPGMVRYSVYVGDNLPYVKVGDIGMDLEVDGEDRDVKFFGLDWDFVYKRNSYEKVYKVVFDSPETLPTGKQKVKLKIKSDFTISDSDIEKFVNGIVAYLKANRSGDDTVMEEVSGEDIRFWYNRDNYQSTKGQLGNSCMSYDYCQEYLDIYCDNPKKVSMLVLLTKDRMLIGRALLWRLDNGRRFMDRVYTILDSDARVFTDHARNNGWLYKEKYGGRYKIMDGKKEFEEHLSVTLQNHDFRHYPYLDTLKYLSYDGVLSDVGDSDDKFLNSTDGEYEYDE